MAEIFENQVLPVLWLLAKIIAIVAPIMLSVAYLTLFERKAYRRQRNCADHRGSARWGFCGNIRLPTRNGSSRKPSSRPGPNRACVHRRRR